ncbi:hypothetical protein [Propionicimonas sp.]|uniref:hypothetical protein n=1 Tax=Propionicimonas sp. TaxID=1955623 RepID=UPI0039E5B2EF
MVTELVAGLRRHRVCYAELRPRLVALGVATLVAAGGWLVFWWLQGLRRADVEYIVAGHTSYWWAVLALFAAAAATLVGVWLLVSVILAEIARPLLRAPVRVLGALVWTAGAAFLAIVCYIGLLGVGIEGNQTFLTAEDGTTLMITQDGFDGDMVDFYDPGPGWTWLRRHGIARVDPHDGPCTLTTTVSTLTVACGSTTQSIPRA